MTILYYEGRGSQLEHYQCSLNPLFLSSMFPAPVISNKHSPL